LRLVTVLERYSLILVQLWIALQTLLQRTQRQSSKIIR